MSTNTALRDCMQCWRRVRAAVVCDINTLANLATDEESFAYGYTRIPAPRVDL